MYCDSCIRTSLEWENDVHLAEDADTTHTPGQTA